MNQFLIKQGLYLAIFVSSFIMTSHLMAQSRVPFLKEKMVEIRSMSNSTGEGETYIESGQKSDTFKITVAGEAKVREDKYFCLFCLNTIRIAKNLRIPATIFAEKTFNDLSGIKTLENGVLKTHYQIEPVTLGGKTYNVIKKPPVRDKIELDIVLEVPVDTKASELIVSGPKGATLRKKGKGFLLVEGEAYRVQTTATSAWPLPANRSGEWKGSTKCGEFSFVVDPSGKYISSIEFTKLKSLRKSYSLKSQSEGWPIADDGKFDIDTIMFLDNITFYGKFNQESTEATGIWKMPSGCSSKWMSTRGKLE